MRFAVVGTGSVGLAIASRLDEVGHDVTIGTRDPRSTLARTETDGMGNPSYVDWAAQHNGDLSTHYGMVTRVSPCAWL